MPELVLSLQSGYTGRRFAKDIISGIIVGVIALPLSIAFAIASGAGPAEGLITAAFAGFTAAAFGGSQNQVSGPTGAATVIVAGILGQYGMSGLMLATCMAGIILIIMGVLRLGKLVKYIPFPITVGFTAGIAATIFIGQINDFFGLGLSGLPAGSIKKLFAVLSAFGNISLIDTGIGVLAIIIIVVVPRIQKFLPGPLTAIVLCTILNMFLPVKAITSGDLHGLVKIDVVPSVDFFDFSILPKLIVPAITIAFLATISSLLSAVVADSISGTKHNPNKELIGQGLSNVVSSVFGGIPSTGAVARTTANVRSGGTSPVAAMMHSLIVLLCALTLMPLVKYIPMSVFGAILFVVCYNMLNVKAVKKILKTNIVDILLMVFSFLLTVIFNLVIGILVCTLLSLAYQLVKIYILKKTVSCIVKDNCIKVKGDVSYMNYEKALASDSIDEVSLDMSEVEDVDATVINYLEGKARSKKVKITATNEKIKKKLLKHNSLKDIIIT